MARRTNRTEPTNSLVSRTDFSYSFNIDVLRVYGGRPPISGHVSSDGNGNGMILIECNPFYRNETSHSSLNSKGEHGRLRKAIQSPFTSMESIEIPINFYGLGKSKAVKKAAGVLTEWVNQAHLYVKTKRFNAIIPIQKRPGQRKRKRIKRGKKNLYKY